MPTPIDLVGPFYTDDALSWSQQDTVNYIPVRAEVAGTWTPTKLVDAPGLRPWVWIGHTESGTTSAPIRGLHDVEGQLFAVCGQTLYQISNTGAAIPRGSIPGVGRVSMAHNQVAGGHQLTVVNDTGGYVWNTATQTFTIITDEGFPGSSRVDFIDGYMMHVEPFGRFLLHSDLADALNFNTLDRFEAETQPDRTRSLIVNNQEVWAFGDRTIDVFANAGTAQGTFQNKGVSISVGCIAGASPAIVDNGVAWLGHDRVVYHARGYSPTRISTRAIDVALSKLSLTDIRNAFSFVFEDRGHAIYYLTIPNGPTFGYDFSTGLWHRRASWHPERDISGRWRLSDLVRSNGRWVGADYQTGKLYLLDWDYMLEGCDPLVRERVSPVAHNNGNRFTIDEIELQFETGGPETECVPFPYQPAGPSIEGAAPDGEVGQEYAGYTYTVTQGDAPIESVVIISGTVPAGLAFVNGTINTADPTSAGSSTFTIRVTDTNGLYADHTDTIFIAQNYRVYGAAVPDNEIRWSDFANPWEPTQVYESPVAVNLIQMGGAGRLFVIGAGEVASLDINTETWDVGTTDAPASPPVKSFLQTGASKWIYCTGDFPNVMYRSTNGSDFEAFSPGVGGQIYSLAKRNDVIIGAATFDAWIRSTNEGDNWAESTSPFAAICIRPSETGFFAIADGSTYGWSNADGTSWTTASLPGGLICNRLAVGNGKAMVIAQSGEVYVGPSDGSSPLQYASILPVGLSSSLNDNRLEFAGGKWFTGGNGDEGLTSEDDGASWDVNDITGGSTGMQTFAAETQA
jgi:hypothetical protein